MFAVSGTAPVVGPASGRHRVVPAQLTDAERADWAAVGVDVKKSIQELIAAGLTPVRMRQWIDAGVTAVHVVGWITDGYDPGSVRFWTQYGVTRPGERRDWESQGLTTVEKIEAHLSSVAAWEQAGWSRQNMVDLAVRLGFTVRTVHELGAVGVNTSDDMSGYLGLLSVLNGDTNGVDSWIVDGAGVVGWRAAVWGRAVDDYYGPDSGTDEWRWTLGFGKSSNTKGTGVPAARGNPVTHAVGVLAEQGLSVTKEAARKWLDAGVAVADIPNWIDAGVDPEWLGIVRNHNTVDLDDQTINEADLVFFEPEHMGRWCRTAWFAEVVNAKTAVDSYNQRSHRSDPQAPYRLVGPNQVNAPIPFSGERTPGEPWVWQALLHHSPDEVDEWAAIGTPDVDVLFALWDTITVDDARTALAEGVTFPELVDRIRA